MSFIRHALVGLSSLLTTSCFAWEWEIDERFGNVPFFRGEPMRAEKAAGGAFGIGYAIRLKGRGFFSAFDKSQMEDRARELMRRYRGEIGEGSGIRDERYFLVSMSPDVMVVAPFLLNDATRKTSDEVRARTGTSSELITNLLYRSLEKLQLPAQQAGLPGGHFARLPGPNYAEIGCAFPDITGAVLWVPSLGAERPFNALSRQQVAKALKLRFEAHPSIPGYLRLVGCPV